MTEVTHEGDCCLVLTDEQWRERIAATLKWAGLTWEELQEQGRTQDFETVQGRIAWVEIGHLGDLMEE
ncbi:MAG TPA: hypothetical protein VFQ85_17570 [Mycobacteriales bacterium]|jgi:hypothetical protein|nr:hypothetical protein [Mycobacteriales bacterium]